MTDEDNPHARHGAARRRFLQLSGAGLALGAAPWLASCGGGSEDASSAATGSREPRTYYFSLPDSSEEGSYYLVAGGIHHSLVPATQEHLQALRRQSTSLPVDGITHVAEAVSLPSKSPQLCYVKGKLKSRPGEWHSHGVFMHIPSAAKTAALALRTGSCQKDGTALLDSAAALCGSSPQAALLAAAAQNYCQEYSGDGPDVVTAFNNAVSLIMGYPEIANYDATTLAYIQQNIVCVDINTYNLALSVFQQGAATVQGGWATLVPYIDPDTKLPKLDSTGDPVYLWQYSKDTMTLLGVAINSILPVVKNDPALGANVTALDPTTTNTSLAGKIWAVHNGTPTAVGGAAVATSHASLLLGDAAAPPGFAQRDVSTGNGFAFTGVSQDPSDSTGRTVKFAVKNWFLRYLGLYVRFLDAAGNPIALSSIAGETTVMAQFPYSDVNGTYDAFLGCINQELVVLGVPVKQFSNSYSIKLPTQAASMVLLAGGLGVGSNPYPDTVLAGCVMTATLDLAVPTLFLTMGAVSGLSSLFTRLSASTQLLVTFVPIFLEFIADDAIAIKWGDSAAMSNLAAPMLGVLAKAKTLWALVQEALEEGEAVGVAEDCLPFGIGIVFQAIVAFTTAVQILETATEVGNAPRTFASEVSLTHDLTVTVLPDSTNTAGNGFPANAANYQLKAVCDGGAPTKSDLLPMPSGSSITYKFTGLPQGGKVNVSVQITAADGTLLGAGSTGPVDNTQDLASITIAQVQVALTASTVYSHQRKTAPVNGQYTWLATATPPTPQALSTDNASGNLAQLNGITVSEPFGALGYGWEASSSSVTAWNSNGSGQLHQFANIATLPDPQQGAFFSGKGFPGSAARLSYDRASATSNAHYVDSSVNGKFYVRNVYLSGVGQVPGWDAPDSNLAVGQFNFASDAFLTHPTGKLISINTALNKMEVLSPSKTPVADADAPLAHCYSGPGTRTGLIAGPACAAVAPDGSIYVLEQTNNRVQSFDTGISPVKSFTSETFPLKSRATAPTYLDIAVEFSGYVYVLLYDNDLLQYAMDLYDPGGVFLSTTTNVPGGKLAVDLFRYMYTLNFEHLSPWPRTEPSVSFWAPSA